MHHTNVAQKHFEIGKLHAARRRILRAIIFFRVARFATGVIEQTTAGLLQIATSVYSHNVVTKKQNDNFVF
jgi:hypothetical protein